METKIRNATLQDLPSLLDLAMSVGRNRSADEIRTWLEFDSGSLFVAEASEDGKIVGCSFGIRHTPELGFIGFYVVLEEYRRKGIGRKLWKAAMEHLGDRNVGLNADPVNFMKFKEKEGFSHVEDYVILHYDCFSNSMPANIISSTDVEVATYFEGLLIDCRKKYGNDSSLANECVSAEVDSGSEKRKFYSKATCTHGNIAGNVESPTKSSVTVDNEGALAEIEYSGESLSSNFPMEDACTYKEKDKNFNAEHQIKSNICMRTGFEKFQNSLMTSNLEKSMGEEILSAVVSFDKSLHKRDRSFIVRQTFSWSSCRSKVALINGKVVGYACLRQVVTEHRIISPFYADTEDIAEILLFELVRGFDFSQAPKGIQIRFPDKNIACKKLVEKFGFKENTYRIFTGFTKECINIDLSKIYSFHSIGLCIE